jgi:hypothetical protein
MSYVVFLHQWRANGNEHGHAHPCTNCMLLSDRSGCMLMKFSMYQAWVLQLASCRAPSVSLICVGYLLDEVRCGTSCLPHSRYILHRYHQNMLNILYSASTKLESALSWLTQREGCHAKFVALRNHLHLGP